MNTVLRNTIILLIVISLVLLTFFSYFGLYREKIIANGIFGNIILGPAEPYFGGQISGGNYVPYAATVAVLTPDGLTEVERFTADENGYFKVYLEPGKYLLRPEAGGPVYPRADEKIVTVGKGSLTKVDIVYDTGVR